uniref:XRE family transcriptional regulator n=1 Tax=uncultured Bacteroides sp. TaxID=162156 RepID=UPI0025EFEBA7|nr:XRE family transcriptional regulator [uncultured Bacteroides sp.]
MEHTVNERIKCLIDYLQLSETKFSIEIGIRQSVINSMFNKGTEPSMKTAISILNTYTFVSAEWLMRGKGEMILTGSTNPEDSEKEIFRLQTENKLLRELIGLKNEESKEKIKSA